LTYTFSADETLTLQSASPADSYRGVLAAPASDDAKSRFVQLTCIVQDSLGAKSVVSAWVEIAQNPTEGTDPLGFLESQLEAVQELLGGQKDGAPGATSTTLALLILSQCVDMLNSEAATSVAAFINGVKVRVCWAGGASIFIFSEGSLSNKMDPSRLFVFDTNTFNVSLLT